MAEERSERRTVDPAYGSPADPVDPAYRRPETGSETAGTTGTTRQKSPAELERDIRHTRAEMSETVDAIERKLSPQRLKHEVQETVHDTIHQVQDRFHPKRLARKAGRSMLDTIKENPLPALVAGLSVGWLIFQGSHDDERQYGYDYDYYGYPRTRSYGSYGSYGSSYGRGEFYGTRYHRPGYSEDPYYAERAYGPEGYYDYDETYGPEQSAAYGGAYETGYRETGGEHSTAERAREKAGEMKHRAQERAGEMMHQAEERLSQMGHQVEYRARRARSGIESFVYGNPLAAGAIALGIGALLGGILPSTHREDEMMGHARDRVIHKAEHVAERAIDKAEQTVDRAVDKAAHQTADRAAEQAKSTVHEVAQKAKPETHEASGTSRHETRTNV